MSMLAKHLLMDRKTDETANLVRSSIVSCRELATTFKAAIWSWANGRAKREHSRGTKSTSGIGWRAGSLEPKGNLHGTRKLTGATL
jgi:hypothetical protein